MTSTVDCFKNIKLVIEAKHQWEAVMDALPQLICLVDGEGAIIRSNKTIERWQMGSVTDVQGKSIHDIIHKNCNVLECDLKFKISCFIDKLLKNEVTNFEFYIPESKKAFLFSGHEGTKSQYREGYAFIVVTDVTQQKKAQTVLKSHNKLLEEKLEERTTDLRATNKALKNEIKMHKQKALELNYSEERYTKLVENSLTGMYITDKDRIIFCNNRFAEIFDYSKEKLCELKINDIFCPRYDSSISDAKRWSDGQNSKEEIISGHKSDGSMLWLNRYIVSFNSADKEMFMGSVTDITEDKHNRDSLRWSERELKMLSQKLLEVQESERKRIALELHDSVGQSINAIKLQIENKLSKDGSGWSTDTVEMLNETIDKLGGTVDDVRRISMNLRPSMLDDLGLLSTISWFVREFKQIMPGITVDMKLGFSEDSMPDSLKLTIFRVIQEAFNNIAKHAKASNVQIVLDAGDNSLKLVISDDGKGFDVRLKALGDGFGLRSMRERVKLGKGEFSIISTQDDGTQIKVIWGNLKGSNAEEVVEKKLDKQTDSRIF